MEAPFKRKTEILPGTSRDPFKNNQSAKGGTKTARNACHFLCAKRNEMNGNQVSKENEIMNIMTEDNGIINYDDSNPAGRRKTLLIT